MLDVNTDLSELIHSQIEHHDQGYRTKYKAITMIQNMNLHPALFGLQRGETLGIFGPTGSGKTALLKFIEVALSVSFQDSRELRLLSIPPSHPGQSLAAAQSAFDVVVDMFHPADIADRATRSEFKHILRFLLQERDGSSVAPSRSIVSTALKIHLGKALVDHPDVLLLDEPTAGLEDISREMIYQTLAQLQQASGTTIILTTQDPGEAEQLCDRVIVLDDGRVLAFGLTSHLERLLDLRADHEAMLARLHRNLTPEPTWVG